MIVGIPNNLIPYLTPTAAGLREYLSVYGDDYDTPDGSAIRDYIDVVDLSTAHVCAVDRLLTGGNSSSYEFFNTRTDNGVSVLELINSFYTATGIIRLIIRLLDAEMEILQKSGQMPVRLKMS